MGLTRHSHRLKLKKRLAFTLIEILVVVTIIAILFALAITQYDMAQKKSRDSRRVADLLSLKAAIELYRHENGVYPEPGRGYRTAAAANWSGPCEMNRPLAGVPWIKGLAPTYIDALPEDPYFHDPNVAKCYCYSSDGQDYSAIAWNSMESLQGIDASDPANPLEIRQMDRPSATDQMSVAVYSPGGKNW